MRRRFYSIKKKSKYSMIYYTTSDQSIVIPNGAAYFGATILSNNYVDGVGIITFDNEISTIGNRAFYNCDSLTSIHIPNSVTKIGGYAFEYCYSLTSVTIPNSVTEIGINAFDECTSLASVTIPDSVTKIGGGAFRDCTSLTSVYCKATTPPTLDGIYIFGNNGSGRKIYVPYQSLDAYKTATNWSEYAGAIVGYDFQNDAIM